MNAPSPFLRSNPFFCLKFTLLGLALLFGASGCSSGGGSSDEDPSGLYQGSATLDGAAPTDLRAFVYGNRIIAFSVDKHWLIDGNFTEIDDDEYSATVDVYVDGDIFEPNVEATGLIVEESSITGTINGSGLASGSFVLTFDNAYKTSSTEAKISTAPNPSDWEGVLLSSFSLKGDVATVDSADVFIDTGVLSVVGSIRDDPGAVLCNYLGPITIPNGSVNIYKVDFDIPSTINMIAVNSACTLPVNPATKYEGFAAVLSESALEEDLLLAATNGDNSIFGLLTILP